MFSELASGSHGPWFESRKTQQFFLTDTVLLTLIISKNIDIWILRKEQNLFRSEFYMCVFSFLSFQHQTTMISCASSWSPCFFFGWQLKGEWLIMQSIEYLLSSTVVIQCYIYQNSLDTIRHSFNFIELNLVLS